MNDAETKTGASKSSGNRPQDLQHACVGLEAETRALLGEWIYVEGARMNYRGLFVDLHVSPSGDLLAVVLDPAYRLGWWNKDKPLDGFHFRISGRCIVPWDFVHAISKQFEHWSKT